MRRSVLFLTLGTLCTAILISLVSVYMFHDVNRDRIGHLNQAFAGLCAESGVFALIVGAATGVLTAIGRSLLQMKGYRSRAALGLTLGAGVTICQYPWDLVARKLLPTTSDLALSIYLVIAVSLCTAVLLRDGFLRSKLQNSPSDFST